MELNLSSEKPIFIQISEEIEDAIFTGIYPEETQIPSTTEISSAFQINPATVLKGMNLLVDKGLIYKKRGVGMYVAKGASDQIRQSRQTQFYENYLRPLIKEAEKLNLTEADIIGLLERGFKDESNSNQ